MADGGGDPIGGLADAALMAGGAEVAAFAGEGEEAFVTAVGAVEAEKAGGEDATVLIRPADVAMPEPVELKKTHIFSQKPYGALCRNRLYWHGCMTETTLYATM